MVRNLIKLLVVVLSLALLGGCATVIKPIPAQDLNPKLKSGALVQKTDNFQVIMDTSASMEEPYEWKHFAYTTPMKTNKLEYQQHLVRLFNDTIPNLKLTAGLRDFAGQRWLTRPFDTKLWFGMAPYVKEDFGKAIFEVNTAGVESPLDKALDAATADLKPLAGKSAVVIFSDGLEMPKAPASAQAMKAALQDRVCIYAVLIGKDPTGEGKALLDKVVKAGQCGFMVTGQQVESAAGMADFVEKIFLGPPVAAAAVPPAAVLPPGVVSQLDTIYFDFDKYNVKPEFKDVVKKNADYFKTNKANNVLIAGNCDERGTNEYNMALGQRRADSAAKALKAAGVEEKRIKTVSWGEEKPVCKESNEACWSKNRNAMFFVMQP
ncbi:MAG: peptidoglycan-associated lipoprotein Pal [Syntrophobacterales bacterium]|nr:peptidoglycan-associated lipoprotein Pal [Syntrophobacterales bacterium]